MLDWPKWVTEALGAKRTEALAQIAGRVASLQAMTVDQSTVDVVLVPLKGHAAKRWETLGLQRHEDWVFVASADGTTILAADEPSDEGMRDQAAAVIYPELHTRLVSWWLVHAWRGVDLLQDTLENLRRWRISSGAVTGRAVVEEAGSLVDEATKLAEAWKVSKAVLAEKFERAAVVRSELEPILLHAGFGSRLKASHKKLQATSVLTLVKKLAKMTDDERFTDWYDWLSDAAHPALGARIAFASPPMGARHRRDDDPLVREGSADTGGRRATRAAGAHYRLDRRRRIDCGRHGDHRRTRALAGRRGRHGAHDRGSHADPPRLLAQLLPGSGQPNLPLRAGPRLGLSALLGSAGAHDDHPHDSRTAGDGHAVAPGRPSGLPAAVAAYHRPTTLRSVIPPLLRVRVPDSPQDSARSCPGWARRASSRTCGPRRRCRSASSSAGA